MAIGWLTVLQSVPWTEVVNNAPKVASGAKKLWNAVGKKTPAVPEAAAETTASVSPQDQTLATLQLRIAELEAVGADVQNQMIVSSGLIKELAEQNTQLILRIDALRKRLGWLTGLLAVTGLMAGAGLVQGLMG